MENDGAGFSPGEFVKFKPLSGIDVAQVAATFTRMAEALTGSGLEGKVRFRLVSNGQWNSFSLTMKGGTAKVEQHEGRVDFEVITTPETWQEIAGGSLAPLDAFTQGRMRVRGDIQLGQRLMRRLADGRGGRTDFC